MREKGIKLTPSGLRCCNPECGAVLYRELMAATDAEACFECDPQQFREGWHPAVAHLLAAELFERTGGRLPPPLSEVRRKYQQGPCSEACCRRAINPPPNHKGGLLFNRRRSFRSWSARPAA